MNMIKKRCITFIMAFFIVFNTVAVAPMQVQASGALTMTALESLLALFGLELGLGNQSNFFSNSEFTDFVDAVVDGRTVSMPIYGEVNFSDGESILSWLSWANKVNDRVGGNNVVDVAFDATILTLAHALDKTSYASTGSSATNVMGNKIDILKGYYDTATDFAGEIRDAFGAMVGKSDGTMTHTRWDMITGMVSTFMYGTADKISGLVNKLRNPQNTVYDAYSSFYTSTGGYDPKGIYYRYNNLLDPQIEEYREYFVVGSFYNDSNDFVELIVHQSYFEPDYGCKYYGIINADGKIDFKQVYLDSGKNYELKLLSAVFSVKNDEFYHNRYTAYGWPYDIAKTFKLPIFESNTHALAYFKNGANVAILNLAEGVDIYPTFREEVGINTLDISDMIRQLIDTVPSVDDISKAIPTVLERADDAVGTHTAILDMTTAIADIGGILVDNQVQNNANAKGIIGAIQAQTKSLIDGLKDALKWLLDSLKDVLLSVYKVAVLPDTEYWKRELDIRVETINTNASVMVLPLSIITLLFGTITNASGIPDFVLTIPPIVYKGYVLFDGCSFNFNQFLAQDMFKDLHNLFIVVTDAMFAFWLVRYASRNFDEIIKGR